MPSRIPSIIMALMLGSLAASAWSGVGGFSDECELQYCLELWGLGLMLALFQKSKTATSGSIWGMHGMFQIRPPGVPAVLVQPKLSSARDSGYNGRIKINEC
ncbi:hypothetical protein C8R44DRAFT_746088 [Mycena epipterygia]|nr:hypothetical protein C8R44DRAFT_746088 [Mycena epipterygia]